MKKALSLMLTVVVLLTMAVPAFAVDATTSASEAWTGTTETPATTTPVTTETPAVTTPAPVATQGQVTYTVKAGDVFWKIAKDNGLTTAQLTALNPAVKNPSVINVGDVIIVKAGTTATTVTTPVIPVATTHKLYLGAGMVPNYRDRGGAKDNLNLTTASVVFDEAGKIVSLQWDVLEITTTMFNWIPAPAATDTVAKDAKADAIEAILDWETKREEGFAYDMTRISTGTATNLTKKEWFEQLDYFEEFFTGKTLGEVQVWFMRYTDVNGRPFKLAYPEKLTDADKAEIANFTEAEKEMLIDVTTSATMSLQDSHSYFIDALVKAWYDREEIK